MSPPKCKTCVWWLEKEGEVNSHGESYGDCHYNSPSGGYGFSLTFNYDFCKDHQKHEPSAWPKDYKVREIT